MESPGERRAGPGVRRQRAGAADDVAHLHGRAAAARRDAQDRRRVPETQPEREGGDRGRRRDLRGAAAVPVDRAVVEGLGAGPRADRRDPPGAVGRAGLGRAAGRLPRRRQGEDPAHLPQGLRRGEPGRRQAGRAAVLRRLAVPVLPQGPAREVQAAGAEDVGRVDGHGEGHHGRREEPEPAGLLDGGGSSPRAASSISTRARRASRSSSTAA
jgi:hypothetical protein